MAIVFDAATSGGRGFGLARTFAHTIGANKHRILFAGSTDREPSTASATFAGLPMLQAAVAVNGAFMKTYMFYMINPPIGVNNVVITWTGNVTWACGAVSYDGVDPVNTFGTLVTAIGNTNTPTVNVASIEDEVVVDSAGFRIAGASAFNAGALQTQRVSVTSGAGDSVGHGQSDEPGQAAVTMSWTIVAGAGRWATVAVPIKPFSSTRGRATKYFFPFWDANPKLFDANGKIVDPSDILADEWVEAEGLGFPTAENPESFIEDPSRSKIIEVNATQASARMKTNTNQFAETLVSRVAAGS